MTIIADVFPPTDEPPVLSADMETLMRAIAHQAEIASQLTAQAEEHYQEIVRLRMRIADLEQRIARRDGRRRKVE